jgi:hypothetical protein
VTSFLARLSPATVSRVLLGGGLAFGAVWSLLDSRSSQFLVVAWVLFGLATVAAYLSRPELRTSASPVTVVVALVLLYGIYVPVNDLATRQTFVDGIDYSDWYSAASGTTALAGFGFVVGYLASRRASLHALGRLPERPALTPVIWKVGAVVWLLLAYRLARYGVGTFTNDAAGAAGVTAYLTYAPQYVGAWGLVLCHAGRSRREHIVGWISVITAGALTVNAFARYIFILMALSTLLLLVWRRRGVRGSIALLLVGLVGAALLIGIQGNRRSEATSSTARASSSVSSFRTDLEIVAPLAATIKWADDHAFLKGTSYGYVVPQAVPRQLWRSKPIDPTLTTVAQYTDPQQGRSMPLWGEMYLNFGIVGVLLGMLIIGYGYGFLIYRWSLSRSPLLDVTVALLIALIVQAFSRALFVQAVYNGFGFLVVPLVILVLERRSKTRTSNPNGGSQPQVSEKLLISTRG